MFNPLRLKQARERRKLTKKAFADLVGVSSKTISVYESSQPLFELQEETIESFAQCLGYPVEFFYKKSTEIISSESISYRAVTTLSSKLKLATESASINAFELSEWIDSKFSKLPKVDLPDYSHDNRHDPEAAASELRDMWGLGELAIKNIVHLLESKGVRVFSLSEDCKEVDAFSFWKGGKPFVILNQFKTPERSRFDAAHELAHLILHKHSSQNKGREAELEADRFASAFLIPRGSVLSKVRPNGNASLTDIIDLKKNWHVSAMAMIRRLYDLNCLTEWQYRQLTIQANKEGYRSSEPIGLEKREQSLLLEKVFASLKEKGVRRNDIARELALPLDEISSLTFNNTFFNLSIVSQNSIEPDRKSTAQLSLVK
ncbi:ImmA/IrrE family metallo-endopeptidase [Vibrio sp. Isolate25]|uniref:ImmA/IrrE family metallo-endopeptidase n=1 Tax=Vibrio TaxID=662 RepID=UPI001EFD0F05|nr:MULTISPECIES: ImmA/IrrE family metallo-endopeptidase [Vibrio]MBE3681819.1 ImmA/IrrE family metallo-endopeptidase [Vibrio parahaemolyticus]MCG9584700.1 ImmA/IrrE family metallo-endopeptidase [Vibrio tubiashii]MCG9598666.1 ImmA/IrrE family metallo-endopeptidase [Vibrio sp. Isolate25]MCG9618228.1 ImmA/IrrE family metallo-endopeptidase [Vibrio tubiashii]MCG9686698.1 ImmA/IrrE family metallo-endopeptidase [Vibrio tubiashii]